MKKNVALGILILACIILGLLIAKAIKERREYQKQLTQTKLEVIKDSLVILSKKENLHRDSAQYYHEKATETYTLYLSAMADTSAWANLRAKYRSDLRAKIRAGAVGYGDSL